MIHFKKLLLLCACVILQSSCANHTKENEFNYQKLKERSKKWNVDYVSKENLAIMLSVFDELYYRKEVIKSAKNNSTGSRFSYIKNASLLRERLRLAEVKYNRKCHNKNESILLFGCLITKNDGVDLQEWLVWQIVIVGVNHIIVYLNDPDADNSWTVLQPFIKEGYVTAFNRTHRGYQNKAYNHCITVIRAKACHYSGTGKLPIDDCPVKKGGVDEYHGNYSARNRNHDIQTRQVWVSGFDSDEFPVDTHYRCYSDILANYSSQNGLMMPWVRFGHNQKFLSPEPGKLVTEAYTERRPDCKPNFFGKAFNRVSKILTMDNSHAAKFSDGQFAVTEFYKPSNWVDGPMDFNFVDPPVPSLRLHHYLTKSVEHLIKKWVRGLADYQNDRFGRPEQRSVNEIVAWLEGFATDWTVKDDTALSMAAIVRTVLMGEYQ